MLMLSLALAIHRQEADYHGFTQTSMKWNGLDAIVVKPKQAAKGRPWIWRTEFFDHRPMLDLEMLKRGYHLVYLNVGNTFGCPSAMENFSGFYRELTTGQFKLNSRVVLEGFSRGGLYAYNWAIRNPNKVQAIYGDAPVCDFRTWPYGGKGAQRSEDDWKQLIKLYDFPTEQQALDYFFQPVNCLDVLATARIPIIHVVGDADEAVPVAANSNLVEANYKDLGGVIEVIHKPGGLHHPHSLDDPTPIADFLTKHADDSLKSLPSTMIPAPNLESRYDSAGWQGKNWLEQHTDGAIASLQPGNKVVLLGDSITQGFGGAGRTVGEPGGAARKKWLDEFGIANEGISGDRVQHVLYRLANNALSSPDTKIIAIMIGINNSGSDSADDVVRGIENLARQAHENCKKATILVQPLLPTGKTKDDPLRKWCDEVNRGLRLLNTKGAIRLAFDGYPEMLAKDGSQREGLFADDHLHLVAKGYEVWGRKLHDAIKKAIN